jgi:hypothetical protein
MKCLSAQKENLCFYVVKKTTLFELALENLDDLYGNKDYFNVYLNPKKLRAP